MKKYILAGLLLWAGNVFSQTASVGMVNSFIDYQKTFPRPDETFRQKEEMLKAEFKNKNLEWPAKYIYIRSFKYDSQLEVWVKQNLQDNFTLFKTYKVCALAGTLGPKRMEGDYQVPEGFYYINEFNPRSSYYLSLGLNYPNASDRILSDSAKPGSAIYIHGSCVTVGCIPIMDEQIGELYILAAHAKNAGQDFIPVHIFPIRYFVKKSSDFLEKLTKDDPVLKRFSTSLEAAYNYFEKTKQVPVILINSQGEYIVNNPVAMIKPMQAPAAEPIKAPKVQPVFRVRNVPELAESVYLTAQYKEGTQAYTHYIDKVEREMSKLLPKDIKRAFVQVEFIVDKDGVPVNFKVLKGISDEDFINELILKMEKMGNWVPAQAYDKNVAKKMVQTLTIEAQ